MSSANAGNFVLALIGQVTQGFQLDNLRANQMFVILIFVYIFCLMVCWCIYRLCYRLDLVKLNLLLRLINQKKQNSRVMDEMRKENKEQNPAVIRDFCPKPDCKDL